MLAGKGYKNIINLSGGIKAWDGDTAYHAEETGMQLFEDATTPEQTLIVAYSLEAGLREFYLSMAKKVSNTEARGLFETLSAIEVKHQERIFRQYQALFREDVSREAFESEQIQSATEGGLTTEEYIDFFKPDMDSPVDIIELAMSIEAQALDLYSRAGEHADDRRSREFLEQMADEERTHLNQLGKLMDTVVEERESS